MSNLTKLDLAKNSSIDEEPVDMTISPQWLLSKVTHLSGALAIFLMFSAHISHPARADAASSPWVKGVHSAARLIAGAKPPANYGNRLLAGVHVMLGKGWKTYWRFPGDAGVPPEFDWSESSNVGDLKVLWPAPKRLHDDYGTSIGYYDEVVFPIVFTPKDAGKPVELKLKFNYAVCKDICIPAEAAMDLQIADSRSSNPVTETLLTGYLSQIPVNGDNARSSSIAKVRDVNSTLAGAERELLIEAVYPKGAGGRDLFAEALMDFYLPVPERVSEEPGGVVRYRIDLSQGDDAKILRGKVIRFTLVSDAGHSEIEWLLK